MTLFPSGTELISSSRVPKAKESWFQPRYLTTFVAAVLATTDVNANDPVQMSKLLHLWFSFQQKNTVYWKITNLNIFSYPL